MIYVPAFGKKVEEKIEDKIPLEKLQGKGERILLVEDEKEVCQLLARMLSDNGYRVITTPNAKEALSAFEKEEGKFDLIFSDVVLPDRSGLQLVKELLSRSSKLSVLLTSGYPEDKSQWSFIRQKGFSFPQKPCDLTNLLQLVRKAIRQTR